MPHRMATMLWVAGILASGNAVPLRQPLITGIEDKYLETIKVSENVYVFKPKIDWSREVPELPVVPSTVSDLEAKITGIVAKLDKLPLDTISADLTKVLTTLSQTLEDASKAVNRIDSDVTPGLKTTLDGLRGTISAVDRTLTSTDATLVGRDAPAQQDLRDALQEIARAARSLRILTDFLEQHPEALIRGKSAENP